MLVVEVDARSRMDYFEFTHYNKEKKFPNCFSSTNLRVQVRILIIQSLSSVRMLVCPFVCNFFLIFFLHTHTYTL